MNILPCPKCKSKSISMETHSRMLQTCIATCQNCRYRIYVTIKSPSTIPKHWVLDDVKTYSWNYYIMYVYGGLSQEEVKSLLEL